MKIVDFHILKIIVCLLGLISPIKSGCHFPKNWTGKWFQAGQQTVAVNLTHIEPKGVCVEQAAEDRFLIEDKNDNCYRCMVIHEKHENVLQFKETYCLEKGSLDSLCEKITGDALLYSMFRLDAKPIPCPFKNGPPFTFTYNRGSGECSYPVSKADSCTDDSRMLLRYQACPDVRNSESTVEELTCLASWRDGSTRYMVGKLEHKMTLSDDERYRCFVWESHDFRLYYVAQSGDATCNGLPSATEGSRTMQLNHVDLSHQQNANCKFPSWLTDHHTWHLLDGSKKYHFSPQNGTLSVWALKDGEENILEMRAVCNSILASADGQIMISAHITVGCDSGYRCISFYRRDGHVVEIQQSSSEVQISEDACTKSNFNSEMLPFITLITPFLKKRKCPFVGRYTVTSNNDIWQMAASKNQIRSNFAEEKVACENGKQILTLGCNKADTMEFQSECSSEVTAEYSCHGDWTDSNGTSYLIALPMNRVPTFADKFCFVIRHLPDSSSMADRPRRSRHLQLYTLTKSCRRNLQAENSEQYWLINITHHADCDGLVSQASRPRRSHISVLLISITVIGLSIIRLELVFR